MAVRSCPQCRTPTFRQPDQPVHPRTDFYRCRVCDHAWSVDRARAYAIDIVSHSELRPASARPDDAPARPEPWPDNG